MSECGAQAAEARRWQRSTQKNEIETVHNEERKNKAVTHSNSNNNAIGINRFGAVISRTLKHSPEYTERVRVSVMW